MRNKGGHIGKYLFFTFAFLLFTFIVSAQKIYTKSIGILTENDSYMMMGKDGYYTNGLTLSYSWTSKDSSNKTINSIEFGQLMYNAKNGSYQELWKIDRPVTAYLFGRYSRTQFYGHNLLNWKAGIGTIGTNAFGRQVQEFIHRTLGMYRPREWQFQLQNAFSVDASVLYVPQIFKEQPSVNIYPIVSSNIGMTFTNIKTGGILTIGKKNVNEKSALWNAQINKTSTDSSESFFYFNPILTYYIYNATVQGSLFKNDPHAGTLNRLLFTPKFGWQYDHKRFSLNIGITYTSREAKEQLYDQWYGSIQLGWSW